MGSLFTKLFSFLLDLGKWLWVHGYNLIIDLINAIIVAVAFIFKTMLVLLPDPEISINCPQTLVDFSNQVSWFIPLGTMYSCIVFFGAAVAGYFAIRPVLKFFHLT